MHSKQIKVNQYNQSLFDRKGNDIFMHINLKMNPRNILKESREKDPILCVWVNKSSTSP